MRYVPINPGCVDAFKLGPIETLPANLGIKMAKDVLPPNKYNPQYAEYYVIGHQIVAPGSYAIWNDGRTQIAQIMSAANFEAIYKPEVSINPEDVVLEIDPDAEKEELPQETTGNSEEN